MFSKLRQMVGWAIHPHEQEAADILHSAKTCADAILARREELDRQGYADKPLVVILGEQHSRPSHYVHHMALLDQLLQQTPDIAFLTELPSNVAPELFKKHAHEPIRPGASDLLHKKDSVGALSLKSCLAWQCMPLANHSTATLLHGLLNRDVPVRFSDTARTASGKIDPADPETAQSLTECFGKVVEGLSTRTRAGHRVRNQHMMRTALEFGEETGARIIIQRCGNHHVMGTTGENPSRRREGRDSLAALLKEQDVPVMALPILSGSFQQENIPADHGLEPHEWLPVEHLSETRAEYKRTGHPLPEEQEAEAAYINSLLHWIGMEDDCLSVEEYQDRKDSLKQEMRAAFRAINHAPQPDPQSPGRKPEQHNKPRRNPQSYDVTV